MFSEMWVELKRTTLRHIPKDRTLHNRLFENSSPALYSVCEGMLCRLCKVIALKNISVRGRVTDISHHNEGNLNSFTLISSFASSCVRHIM